VRNRNRNWRDSLALIIIINNLRENSNAKYESGSIFPILVVEHCFRGLERRQGIKLEATPVSPLSEAERG